MANRIVTLVRNSKTEKGWRRYPVAFGRNGRVRPGWAMDRRRAGILRAGPLRAALL